MHIVFKFLEWKQKSECKFPKSSGARVGAGITYFGTGAGVKKSDSDHLCLVCLLDICCVWRWQSFNGFTCALRRQKWLQSALRKLQHCVTVNTGFPRSIETIEKVLNLNQY